MFHMLTKLENMDVSSFRLRSCCGVQRRDNQCQEMLHCCIRGHTLWCVYEQTHRVYELKPIHIRPLCLVELVDDLPPLTFSVLINETHLAPVPCLAGDIDGRRLQSGDRVMFHMTAVVTGYNVDWMGYSPRGASWKRPC